jgi:hypothetical protein|tara:strand:+ start:299 stop:910 length:612 start_codon:yes stop_codon:yes gene_type:complete
MFSKIYQELKHHAPFTVFGALSGVIIMLLFKNLSPKVSYNAFYIFHPIHVLLSAIATASMYEFHRCSTDRKNCNIFVILLVGYFGAIGVATLSDSLIPYFGESLLKMPHRQVHIGFIEKWWLINPLAIAGIAIAYFRPNTKFSHYGHVLLSTWASLFHILMAGLGSLDWLSYLAIFMFLFLAVWLPCCISDIVFPLLFVRGKK